MDRLHGTSRKHTLRPSVWSVAHKTSDRSLTRLATKLGVGLPSAIHDRLPRIKCRFAYTVELFPRQCFVSRDVTASNGTLRLCTRLSVALLVACTGSERSKNPSSIRGTATQGTDLMSAMKPGGSTPGVSWERGPALTSSTNELVAWFEAETQNGELRLMRVPIVLNKGVTGWSTNGVRIGATRVHIDDSALGIGIAMRANACTEVTCAFLVEGWWRGSVDGTYEYEIRRASATPMSAAEFAATTHVEVERGR